MRQNHLHDEERLQECDANPGVVVFARVMSHPWWPAVIGRCPASGAWQNNGSHRWVFFLNDDNGAWLRLSDLRPYGEWNKETVLELNSRSTRFFKYSERIATACIYAEELLSLEPLNLDLGMLARFSPSLNPSAIAPANDDGIEPLLDGPPPVATGPSAITAVVIPHVDSARSFSNPPSPRSEDAFPTSDAEASSPALQALVSTPVADDHYSSPVVDAHYSSPTEDVIPEDIPVVEPVPVAQPPVDVVMTDGRPKRKRTKSTRLNGFVDPNEHRTKPSKSRIDADGNRRERDSVSPLVTRPACPLRLPLNRGALLKNADESDDDIDNGSEGEDEERIESNDEVPEIVSPVMDMEDVKPSVKLLPRVKKVKIKSEKLKGKSPLVVRFRKELIERVQGAARNGGQKAVSEKGEKLEDDEVLSDEVPRPTVRRSTRASVVAAKSASPIKQGVAGTAGAGPSRAGRPANKGSQSGTKGRRSPRKSKNNKRSAPSSALLLTNPENDEAGNLENDSVPNTNNSPTAPPSKRRRVGSARATVNASRPARDDDETDTDEDEDLMQRFLPTPNRDTAARILLAQDVAAINGMPAQTFGNNIHPMSDAWAAMLNRVAALEEEVRIMRREREQCMANLLAADATSANFKTSVEVIHLHARHFVEARRHNAADIEAGIRLLWPAPPADSPPEPAELSRETLRHLSISAIWQYFSKTVGHAMREQEQQSSAAE